MHESRTPPASTRSLCIGRSRTFTPRPRGMFQMAEQGKREYRVKEHNEGYVVQSRTLGSHQWIDGPVFLSEEKAQEAMRRLADASQSEPRRDLR
jgi:hypothetical protein